jgi:hypothetical protein
VTAEFRCEDWRGAPNEEVAPLLAREAAAWDAELGWDIAHSWRVIEPARAAGMLPASSPATNAAESRVDLVS